MLAYALLGLLAGRVAAHDDLSMPRNPMLGVPGFPDCERLHPLRNLSVDEAAMDLRCGQKGPAAAIKIGCVGDSITAGVHSSGGIHPYPAQLQILLDKAKGKVSSQHSQCYRRAQRTQGALTPLNVPGQICGDQHGRLRFYDAEE
jgi:hypothetical protein